MTAPGFALQDPATRHDRRKAAETVTTAGNEAADDRPLPAHIRRALDQVVNGPGRTATTAHPDCVCHKVIGTRRPPWLADDEADLPVWGRKEDCPQHRPEPKR